MSEVHIAIERIAEQLGEKASVHYFSEEPGDQSARFTPRNAAAATVTVHYSPVDDHAEPWLEIEDEYVWPGDVESLTEVLQGVITGGVLVIEGSGRSRIEVRLGDREVYSGTSYGVVSLVPSFGWRKRATVTSYEPYL